MDKAEVVSILKNASQMLPRSWDLDPISDTDDKEWKILDALATFIKQEAKEETHWNSPNCTLRLSSDDVFPLLKKIDYLLISPDVVKTISRRVYNVAFRLQHLTDQLARFLLCFSVESPVWEIVQLFPVMVLEQGCRSGESGKAIASVEQVTSLLSMEKLCAREAYLVECAAKSCIGQSTEDTIRVLDAIYWHEISFFWFPRLVQSLCDILPNLPSIYPRLLVEFASVMTTYHRNTDVASLAVKPTRHKKGSGVWRQFIGKMEPLGDAIYDYNRPGIVCLDPSPRRVCLDDDFMKDRGWYESGTNIVIQSGDDVEFHAVHGAPHNLYIETETGREPRCKRLMDENGFSAYLVTTRFTETYHVRVGPIVHSFDG